MAWYVNAYETYDVYGGPEEGGWWYTAGEPTGESWGPYDTLEEAREQQDALYESVDARNEGRWPRSSSNGGDWYAVLVEPHEGRSFPEEYPRYE